jgi:hypothetical protein
MPLKMDLDSDPDPAIFVIDHKDAKKTNFLKRVFLLISFREYLNLYHFSKIKIKRSHKTIP